MTHGRSSILAALALTSLLAAGCGGGDDGGGKAAASAPSKSEYVRSADRVCSQVRVLLNSANVELAKAFNEKKAGGAADALDRFTPKFSAKVEQLRKLPPPSGDEAQVAGVLRVMATQVDALKRESRALRAEDSKSLEAIGKVQQQAFKDADRLARQYGFHVCGRST
jgi:hypothetical protein